MKVGRPFFCGEFDERIKPAKSFCVSHTKAKTFLEMPRGSSANAKTFFFRFAELPQTPKHIPRDLREYPQTPKHFPWDLREYPQTPKHFPRDLREYPQTPKHFPWDLRNFRGTKALWLLLRAIKDILLGLGSLFFHRTHVVYEITHFLLAIACKMRLKCHRQSEMGFSGLIPYVCP